MNHDYFAALIASIAESEVVCQESSDFQMHYCGEPAIGYTTDHGFGITPVCRGHAGYYRMGIREFPAHARDLTITDMRVILGSIEDRAHEARRLIEKPASEPYPSAYIIRQLGGTVVQERGDAYGRPYKLEATRSAPTPRKKATDKPARRNVSPRMRFTILQRDEYKCQLCGRSAEKDGVKLHVDHQQPSSKGGREDEENLWTLCADCNIGKSDRV